MFSGIIFKYCGCALLVTVTQSVGCGLAMDGTELCVSLLLAALGFFPVAFTGLHPSPAPKYKF